MVEGNIRELQAELEDNMAMKKSISGKVNWSVFVWIVGILTTITGSAGLMAIAAQDKAQAATDRVLGLEGDLKAMNARLDAIKENTDWIRAKLDK